MKTRFALRAATDDVHRELDDLMSRLDLSQAGDYARFLGIHARTVPAVEWALASGGLDAIVEGWSAGRRSGAIEADLAAMGKPVPAPVSIPPIHGVAELLGTAYVLEGSRLGGKVLERRVAPGLPVNFLSHSKKGDPWPTVVAALDRFLYSDALLGEARDAARRCFALFLTVAREAGI
jgi:heme oxygenase